MIVSFVSPASGRPSCFFPKGSGAGERYTGDDKGKPIERWGRKATGPGGLSRSLGRRAAEGRISWTTLYPWGPLRSTQVEPAQLIGRADGIGGDWAAPCTGATWTGRRSWPSPTSGGTRRTPPRGRSGARSSVPENSG